MKRKNIIQMLLNRLGGGGYLEIGVAKGATFFKVKAKTKIGVDLKPNITKKKLIVRSICNLFSAKTEKLVEATSDIFFTKKSKIFLKKKIDVAFIDGLHTYQQALKDVTNCLKYLNQKGFIVLHDCNPEKIKHAMPYKDLKEVIKKNECWKGPWMGDVWKTILYLRSQRKDLHVFTLNCDSGVGIICKGEPENMLGYSREDIEKMSYQDLKAHRKTFLNLKEPDYLYEFLNNLD